MKKIEYWGITVLVLLFLTGSVSGVASGAAQPAKSSVKGRQTPGAGLDRQQKWKTTLEAAKKEGSLTIYGEVSPALREAMATAFEAKYGIKMQFVGGKSAELTTRWERENSAGLNFVDIFHMGGITSTLIMKPKGAFGPIEPNLILPEVVDPKAWPEGTIRFMDKDKTIMPLNSTWTSYVVINTDIVKEGQLKSNGDILNPEWKGKVVLFDPTIPGAATGWVWLMMANFGPEGGKEYMRKLAAMNPPVTRNVRQHVEWVAKGKYAIGIGAQSALVGEFKRTGAPLTLNHFQEAGHIMPGSGCVEIAAKPAHPNAAAVYLNWLLTPEGQLTFNRPTGSPPIRLNMPLEGFNPINIARPTDKVFLTDESFYLSQKEVLKVAKEIFGPLLR